MRARAIEAAPFFLLLAITGVSPGICDPCPPGFGRPARAEVHASPPVASPPRVGTGIISGRVVLADGKGFGFADVTLEPEAGSVYSDSALSEEDGSFRFPAVPVGHYKLSVFADVFKQKEIIVGLRVTKGSNQSLTITLIPIPSETMTVTVEGRTSDILDFRTTDTSSVVSGQFVSKIPLQNKRIQDIVFLSPGTTRTGSSDSSDISTGGGTSGQVGYRLNGQSISDPVNGGPMLDIPSAAIQSYKIISGGFNAAYGEQSSGIANIVGGPAGMPPPMNRDAYAHRADNSFRGAFDDPLSTFAVDVDTASYSNVRRFLRDGMLPPPDAVRIEELINYFRYEAAPPAGGAPFGAATELAECPWAPHHRLLRVSLTTSADARAARAPRSLVFLIDVSGSMGEPDKLPLVKDSLRLLVDRLSPEDEVGIVVYAGAAGLVLPLTPGSDKAAIRSAIDRLSSGGSTNGAQGIQLAYELAETAQKSGAMSRVILATDGDFNVGVTSEGDLVRLIEQEREKGIALTVLGFGTGNLQDDRMEALADHGNGNYAYVDGIAEARKVLDTEMSATLVTLAKDVKIQVEFNPSSVREWRLLGYENRLLAAQDFDDDAKDAGEIGAGHQVTALYEIVPAAAGPAQAAHGVQEPLRYQVKTRPTTRAHADELALLRIRWKEPQGGKSRLFEKTMSTEVHELSRASSSLRFAAAVAAFGLRLRASEGVDMSWDDVRALAASAPAPNPDGDALRGEFTCLIDTAARLQANG